MTLDEILELLEKRLTERDQTTRKRDVTLQKLYDFSHGNQFGENGVYWRGRKPKGGDMGLIEAIYTEDDCIKPALNRFVSAICNKDWEWDTKPDNDRELTPDEQSLEDALSVFHYDAELARLVARALYLALSMGRVYLREYSPDEYASGEQGSSAIDGVTTLPQAFELIHPQVLDARHAGTIKDEHGRIAAYYYRYIISENSKDIPHVELHTPELIYQYRIEGTKLELVTREGQDLVYPNPLYDPARKRKPRFMMREIDLGEPYITPSAIDKQSRNNVSWTNLARNDDLSGFRSGYTINADPPVEVGVDGTEHEAEWTIAPDLMINLIGLPKLLNEKGEVLERYDPEIGFIEPVDPTSFLTTITAYQRAIAAEFDQTWLLDEYKAVSGKSKEESRFAFNKRVTALAQHMVDAAVWLLETTTLYASSMISEREAQKYSRVSFSPTFYLDVPEGDLESFLALMSAYKENLASLDTLLTFSPAPDKAAEKTKLEDEAKRRENLTPPKSPDPEPTQTEEVAT